MVGRILGGVLVALVAGALAVLAWPQLVGLEQAPVVAQAVAMRGSAALIAFAVVILLTLMALLVRWARAFFAGLAIVGLCFVAAQAVVIGTRGAFGEGMPTPAPASITVLAWNTLGETPPVADVADLIEETGADVVSLPETTYDGGAALVDELAARGIEMQQLTFAYNTVAKADSTTLLVGTELGEYRTDTTATTTNNRPTLVATPVDGAGPTLVAAHTTAPGVRDPSVWRADLRWIAELCATPDLIVAGDLNSTIDHWAGLATPGVEGARIGACRDAAADASAAAIGTWPAALPPLLGTPIDHVLTGEAWRTTGFRVIGSQDGSGADHRPVVAQLEPVAAATLPAPATS
ncbi:MAG: endonuclease/exonuclease/phosphatase family protein [Microbacteriaceae bacterium]|nr:endonuclease/exonuclease/phosphatase family protein [Microbacteriaceae bacterium]